MTNRTAIGEMLPAFLLPTLLLLATAAVAADAGPPAATGHELGVSLGTPAALNLEWEMAAPAATFAVSGMFWGDVRGVQVGVAPAFLRWHGRRLRLQMTAGTSRSELEDEPVENWRYFGGEIVWHPRRFLLAAGVTGGSGSYSSPQASLRVGFLWRL